MPANLTPKRVQTGVGQTMLTSEPQQTRTTRATRPKGRDWVIEQGRALFVAMLFLICPFLLASASAQQETAPFSQSDRNVDAIIECMRKSLQAVLLPGKGVKCTEKSAVNRLRPDNLLYRTP